MSVMVSPRARRGPVPVYAPPDNSDAVRSYSSNDSVTLAAPSTSHGKKTLSIAFARSMLLDSAVALCCSCALRGADCTRLKLAAASAGAAATSFDALVLRVSARWKTLTVFGRDASLKRSRTIALKYGGSGGFGSIGPTRSG